jgi:hypothetical protein
MPQNRPNPQLPGACVLPLVWLLVLVALPVAARAQASKEYQIKAAFIFNFAKFIDWPARSFGDSSTPIVIGVYGDSAVFEALTDAVRGRNINSRAVTTRMVQSVDGVRQVNMLFIGTANDSRDGPLTDASKAAGVLTIGESQTFANHGGVITFTPEGDKLRFEINMAAAEESGLTVSAQLQKLAKNIVRN